MITQIIDYSSLDRLLMLHASIFLKFNEEHIPNWNFYRNIREMIQENLVRIYCYLPR